VTVTRRITATAPIRTCDCGGWTDTWFARHGAVFHIAIEPGVRVRIDARPSDTSAAEPVIVHAENYADRYAFEPGTRPWVKHPLLEAAIESVGVPPGLSAEIRVQSTVPPGASTGTSAAVCVALIGALHLLWDRRPDADIIAAEAHAVEAERLGQQSGLQDQLAAAHGGVNFIEIADYPSATVHPISLSGQVRAAIDQQLILIYLGRTHSSSAIHDAVIRDMTGAGPGHPALAALREAAAQARDAVVAGDLVMLGDAMRANTEAQRRLHAALVGVDALRVIAIARAHRALGWKVNGAGGEGGSLAVLCGPGPGDRAMIEAAILAASPAYRLLPVSIAHKGLCVSASGDGALEGEA
jgi:D-glycero-alpha-D-manno-heptose-7-phosphate kinase